MNKADKLTKRFPAGVFMAAVEQSSVAISITDAEAKILYVNAAFCEVTGYGLDEVLGRNESLLSDKNTPTEVYKDMWASLVARRPWSGRLINRRKDGTRYLADLSISPVTDVVDGSLFFLGMHRDVTALHRLVRELRNQKLLVETMVNSAPMALALLDTQRRVVLDNLEYKTMAADLGNDEPALLVLEVLRASGGMNLSPSCVPGEGMSGREIELSRADGSSRWYSCSARCFEEEDASADAFFDPQSKTFLLLSMSDITQAKRQYEQERLNALRAVLAEGERVQQLREAIAGAIFQMQLPLNLIGAASAMLARQHAGQHAGGDMQALSGVLTQALEAGHNALNTLRQGMPEEQVEAEAMLNLNMLLRDVLALLTEKILASGIVVDWQPAYALPAVRGQATPLRQMFKQLMQNAIDAMRASRSSLRELRVASELKDGMLIVSITDSGAGVPQDLRLKVFEPFFTTRRAGGGHVGMGLTLAQDVAARHGGWLEIDAEYTSGCRVLIGLPVSVTSDGNGYEPSIQAGEVL